MHREPSRRSEQVSQGLLGERVEVLTRTRNWLKIRTPDRYEGWAASSEVAVAPQGWGPPFVQITPLWANLRFAPDSETAPRTLVSVGTRLPLLRQEGKWHGLLLPGGGTGWVEEHRIRQWEEPPGDLPAAAAIARTARRFLGVPYLWGGRSPLGIDCSGFVQMVWSLNGFSLPRDASDQAEHGSPVEIAEALPGDLLYFATGKQRDRISHVAICLPRGRMIHARGSDMVRVQRRDEPLYSGSVVLARRLSMLECHSSGSRRKAAWTR